MYEFFAIWVYQCSFIDSWYLVYDNPIPVYQIVFIWIQVWWQESLETIGWTSVNMVACQLPESNRVNHWLQNVPLYLFTRVYPRWYFLTKKILCDFFCRLWQRDQWLKHLRWGSHHPDQSFDCKHTTMNKARYACITRSLSHWSKTKGIHPTQPPRSWIHTMKLGSWFICWYQWMGLCCHLL